MEMRKPNLMKYIPSIIISLVLVTSSTYAGDQKYLTVPEVALKGQARTNLDSPKPTEEQLRRKEKFTKMVAALGVPTNKSLPVVEDATTISQRDPQEIAQRAIAVAVAAVKGEGMPHSEVIDIVQKWKIENNFSAQELAFIKNPTPTQSDKIKFAWRYEGLEVLLWALGYKTSLPTPNTICDVKADIKLITENKGLLLGKNAKRRKLSEILDMADFYYRLH